MAQISGNVIKNIQSATTVKAKYKAHIYNLKFVINGGTLTEETDTYTYASGAKTLPTPVRTGYTFKGWYTSPNFTGDKIETISNITSDTTYYAKWEANTYTVTYNVGTNGNASFSFIGKNVVNFTVEDLPLQLLEPTSDGFDFTGWTTTEITDGRFNNTPATPITKITDASDATVYSNWTPKTVNVIEDIYVESTDGKYDLYEEKILSGTVGTTYTKSNVSLIGYSEIDSTPITVKGNVHENIVTRKFDRTTFTVTYNNTSITQEEYYYNEDPIQLTKPIDEDYRYFVRYQKVDGNTIPSINSHNTADVSVDAIWKQKPIDASSVDIVHMQSSCTFNLNRIEPKSGQVIEYSINGGDWTDLPTSKAVDVDAVSESEGATAAPTYILLRYKAFDKHIESDILRLDAKCLPDSITYSNDSSNTSVDLLLVPATDNESKDGSITILSKKPMEYLFEHNTIVNVPTGTKFERLDDEEVLTFRLAETNRHIASGWLGISCKTKLMQDAPSTTGVEIINPKKDTPQGTLKLPKDYPLVGANGSGGKLMYSVNNGVTWDEITNTKEQKTTDVTTLSTTLPVGSIIYLKFAGKDTYYESNWTYIGVVEIPKYTVTFDLNAKNFPTNTAATGSTNEVASMTVKGGSYVTAPTEPTRFGYTFAFWSTDATATSADKDTKNYFSTEAGYGNNCIEEDTTLYAIWKRNELTYENKVIRYVQNTTWNQLNLINSNQKSISFYYGTKNTFDINVADITTIVETEIESLYEDNNGFALTPSTNGTNSTISFSYDNGSTWTDATINEESVQVDVTGGNVELNSTTKPNTIEIANGKLSVARQFTFTSESGKVKAYEGLKDVKLVWTDSDTLKLTLPKTTDDLIKYYDVIYDTTNNLVTVHLYFVEGGLGKGKTSITVNDETEVIELTGTDVGNLKDGTNYKIHVHGSYKHSSNLSTEVKIPLATETNDANIYTTSTSSLNSITVKDGWTTDNEPDLS